MHRLRTEMHKFRRHPGERTQLIMVTFGVREPLNDRCLDVLFRHARTYRAWLPIPVQDHLLREVYDLFKWGPTSANSSPARILFLKTVEAKQRLIPALARGNVEKVETAP